MNFEMSDCDFDCGDSNAKMQRSSAFAYGKRTAAAREGPAGETARASDAS